ncbi:hypothetical protein MTO96_014836 [Rhipicephalus appendiculatus]
MPVCRGPLISSDTSRRKQHLKPFAAAPCAREIDGSDRCDPGSRIPPRQSDVAGAGPGARGQPLFFLASAVYDLEGVRGATVGARKRSTQAPLKRAGKVQRRTKRRSVSPPQIDARTEQQRLSLQAESVGAFAAIGAARCNGMRRTTFVTS